MIKLKVTIEIEGSIDEETTDRVLASNPNLTALEIAEFVRNEILEDFESTKAEATGKGDFADIKIQIINYESDSSNN